MFLAHRFMGFTSCRSRSRDSWKRKQEDLILHHGHHVCIWFVYISYEYVYKCVYILCIYIRIGCFFLFTQGHPQAAFEKKPELPWSLQPHPTWPRKTGQNGAENVVGQKKDNKNGCGRCVLAWNTIQLRRSLRINYPQALANFGHVEKTQDQNMIPPKESRGKELMLSS